MKKLALVLFTLALSANIFAQQSDDPVIFEINGKNIRKSEFMKDFLRSIGKDPAAEPTACTYEKRKALEEYVELFVNFRTKLEDAFNKGYDTVPDMIRELKGYRNELAAPYLIDSATLDNILHEAYERNHYVLHAGHILVKVGRNANPADTLAAYEEIMAIYDRVMTGEDFLSVAAEVNKRQLDKAGVAPDDPRRQETGDLGDFTVFDMVYPFETAAYSLEVGEISKPIRTNYGYHIIKLFEKIPFFGHATLQHIWVSASTNPEKDQARIFDAFNKIAKEGMNFGIVCRDYTDDHATADIGGLLSDMSSRQLPPEYISVMSNMKPGEMSSPFQTKYGWHMILLLNRDSLPQYEDMVPYYKQRLVRDNRNTKPRIQFIEQCKLKYGFVDYTKTDAPTPKGKKAPKVKQKMASLAECRAALNDSVFSKMWKFEDNMVSDMRPLFKVADIEYTAVDFLKFIESRQRAEGVVDLDMYLNERYSNYINDKVFEYADKNLEKEHAEFAELLEEYRNGLMIFSYNDQMIWSKAIKDTVGLARFYAQTSSEHNIDNENDAPYFWNERARLTQVNIDDSSFLAPSKALKLLNKATKKQWNKSQLTEELAKVMKHEGTFHVDELLVEKEHQNVLKSNQWRYGIYEAPLSKGYQLVRVDKLLDPCLKNLLEARGYYINDYQLFLEKQLNQELRRKYNVVIHQDVIDGITY